MHIICTPQTHVPYFHIRIYHVKTHVSVNGGAKRTGGGTNGNDSIFQVVSISGSGVLLLSFLINDQTYLSNMKEFILRKNTAYFFDFIKWPDEKN